MLDIHTAMISAVYLAVSDIYTAPYEYVYNLYEGLKFHFFSLFRYLLWKCYDKFVALTILTEDHVNADALSCLPSSSDDEFDGKEKQADVSFVCCVR